jgi:hypothetical protein
MVSCRCVVDEGVVINYVHMLRMDDDTGRDVEDACMYSCVSDW